MTGRARMNVWALILMLATGAAGCDRDTPAGAGAGASPTAPSAPTPPAAVSAVVSLALVDVPSSLPIGQTKQVRAVATYREGGYVDVSEKVTWRSSDPAICAITADGVASATGAGLATLEAQQDDLSARATLTCGYVVTATVHENAPTENVVLPATRVVVVGGPHTGLVLSTDGQGRVALPPVATGGFRLQFKHPGYDDADYVVRQLPRESALDIGMMPVPSVRREYALSDSPFAHYTETFTTRRAGRAHVEVRMPPSGDYSFASIYIYSSQTLMAAATVTSGGSAGADGLLPAGTHTVTVYNHGTAGGMATLERQP